MAVSLLDSARALANRAESIGTVRTRSQYARCSPIVRSNCAPPALRNRPSLTQIHLQVNLQVRRRTDRQPLDVIDALPQLRDGVLEVFGVDGTLGDPAGTCRCTEEQVARYRSRVSGPLLDRIDLHVEVPRLHDEEDCALAESSAAVRERVAGARAVQIDRAGKPNQGLAVSELRRHCAPAPSGRKLLARAMEKLHLSARARDRVLRVARTIADLAQSDRIGDEHVAEAIGFRTLDRGTGRGSP